MSTEAATTVTETVTEPTPPSLADLVGEVRSGVIRIEASTCAGVQEGTGVLVGPNLVVTAEHVVDGAVSISLTQAGKPVGRGTVIGYDVERDVALIRAGRDIEGHVFVFAERTPRLGEEIAAIGFPLGLPLTVTHGLVSGVNRRVEIDGIVRRRLVQTDAAVNPGNSGGPLVSVEDQEVLGIVSAGSLDVNAIAFAVPSRTVSSLAEAWAASPQPLTVSSCGGEPEFPPLLNEGDTQQVAMAPLFAGSDHGRCFTRTTNPRATMLVQGTTYESGFVQCGGKDGPQASGRYRFRQPDVPVGAVIVGFDGLIAVDETRGARPARVELTVWLRP